TWRSTRTKDHRWTRAASSPVWAWRITRAPPTRAGRANTAARTSGSSGVAARFRWTTSVRPRRTARKIRDACRNVRPTFPNDMAPGTFAPFGAVFRYVKSTRSASHGSVASSVTNVGIPPWVGGPCPTRSTTGRRPLSSQRSPIPELGEQRLARRTHYALPVARPRPVPAAVRFDPRPAVNVRVLHAPVVFEAVVLQDGGLPRFAQEIEHRAERRLGTGGQLLVPQHETRFRVALAEPLHQTCLLGPERRGPDRNVATGPLDVVPNHRIVPARIGQREGDVHPVPVHKNESSSRAEQLPQLVQAFHVVGRFVGPSRLAARLGVTREQARCERPERGRDVRSLIPHASQAADRRGIPKDRRE